MGLSETSVVHDQSTVRKIPEERKSHLFLTSLRKPEIEQEIFFNNFYQLYIYFGGARGGVVVKSLRYKPEGRGFDS